MSKAKVKAGTKVLDQIETGVTSGNTTVNNNTVDFKMPLGRPADPNSKRQLQIAEREKWIAEMKLKHGADWTPKQGRPADPNSKNFKAKQELIARKSDPNYVAKQGRPVDPNSPRQLKLKQQAERRAKLMASANNLTPVVTE